MCIFLYTAPGQVRNIRIAYEERLHFNSTSQMYTVSAVILWEEPTEPNGIITFYELTITQTNKSGDILFRESLVTTTYILGQSMMIRPFTNYTVTVKASTSAGQGDGRSITVVSPEAGKAKNMYYVHVHMHCLALC